MDIDTILQEINNIDWSTLHEEIENCEFVPNAFIGFFSDDDAIRNKSFRNFDNSVVVQSTLYDGAFYVVPFLLEALKQNIQSKRDNYELYNLLFEIGNGSGYNDTVTFEIRTEPFVYYVPNNNGIQWSLTKACREAVFTGWNIFFDDLMNIESPNRTEALEILVMFYEHILMQKTVLQHVVNTEKDSDLGKLAYKYLQEVYYPK